MDIIYRVSNGQIPSYEEYHNLLVELIEHQNKTGINFSDDLVQCVHVVSDIIQNNDGTWNNITHKMHVSRLASSLVVIMEYFE